MKNKIYEKIEQEMKLWRMGEISLPDSYINYHRDLARKSKEELINNGYVIHRDYMDSDGWAMGMRVVYLIVESPDRELRKLSWHDDRSNGKWFEHSQVCGNSFPHKIIKR